MEKINPGPLLESRNGAGSRHVQVSNDLMENIRWFFNMDDEKDGSGIRRRMKRLPYGSRLLLSPFPCPVLTSSISQQFIF